MPDWAAHLMNSHAYLALVLALLLVNLFPPIPAESMIPFTAALFGSNDLDLPLAIASATLGLVLGTTPFYYLGRLLGEERVKELLASHGIWLALTPADVDRSGRWFRKYGGPLVMVGRLIPGMRTLVSVPAGFHRIPSLAFIGYSTVGCACWASVLVLAGHWLSNALPGFTASRILLAFVAVFFCFYVYRLVQHFRAR